MSLRTFTAFACSTFLSFGVAAQEASGRPDWADAVDELITRGMARDGIPGAQIAIAQDGRVVYAKAYGVADVETGRKVTDKTLFHSGSVTKLVTGVVLAQLAVDDVVDLEAPVDQYVTELAGRQVGKATTHQLLTHSAGWSDIAKPHGRTDDAAARDVLTQATDAWISMPPGRVFSYSNNGFAMAGYVAERAAGQPFAKVVEQRVLSPVMLDHATFNPLMAMTRDFSQGHVEAAGTVAVMRPMPVNSAEFGAGFLYATASDLARLGAALMDDGMLDGKRVFPSEAVKQVTGRYISIPGSKENASGYGVQVDKVGGERVWRKNGHMIGFASELSMWPDRRFAVAIMTNRLVAFADQANVEAARVVHGIAPVPKPVRKPESPGTDKQRAEIAGRYLAAADDSVPIVDRDGQLQFQGKRGTFPMVFVDEDVVLLKAPAPIGREFLVLRDKDGVVEFLHSRSRAFRKVRD